MLDAMKRFIEMFAARTTDRTTLKEHGLEGIAGKQVHSISRQSLYKWWRSMMLQFEAVGKQLGNKGWV
jgi:hypothetical protein